MAAVSSPCWFADSSASGRFQTIPSMFIFVMEKVSTCCARETEPVVDTFCRSMSSVSAVACWHVFGRVPWDSFSEVAPQKASGHWFRKHATKNGRHIREHLECFSSLIVLRWTLYVAMKAMNGLAKLSTPCWSQAAGLFQYVCQICDVPMREPRDIAYCSQDQFPLSRMRRMSLLARILLGACFATRL